MVQINFQESALRLPLKGSGLSSWERYPPLIIGTYKRETHKQQGPQVTGNANKAGENSGWGGAA